jgi:hypothetical protein
MTPTFRVAESYEAVRHKGLMVRLEVNPNIEFLDCHEVRSEPGVALLVDPINAAPYVFVPPNSVHTFTGAPGSGTDHLRARIAATQFFESVIEQQQVQSSRRDGEGDALVEDRAAPTAQLAVLRCFVASRLGSHVAVAREYVQEAAGNSAPQRERGG